MIDAIGNLTPGRPTSRWLRVGGLLVLAAAATAATALLPRMPQDPAYHRFADDRTMLGVPNFWDVASGAAFAAVGLMGLWIAVRGGGPATVLDPEAQTRRASPVPAPRRAALGVMFAGVFLTAFGSGWYHLAPSNARLVWDRLPMAVAFMGFLAALIADRVSPRAAAWLLGPLTAVGIAAVLYWQATEAAGAGDLRPYLLVQAFPLLAVVYVALFLRAGRMSSGRLLVALAFYGLAKAAEAYDRPIFALAMGGEAVSGHTLKHLAAALGTYMVLQAARAPRA